MTDASWAPAKTLLFLFAAVRSGRVRETYGRQRPSIVFAELWDVGQQVPAESVKVNGMF